MNEYEQDLQIDFTKMDKNWQDQGLLYMKWGERWANAVAEKDKRRQYLDTDIRANPESYSLKSPPPETGINSRINADSELIELNLKVNLLAVAKTAFEHRRQSLDGLTRLYVSGYFGEPTKSPDIDRHTKTETANSRMVKRGGK